MNFIIMIVKGKTFFINNLIIKTQLIVNFTIYEFVEKENEYKARNKETND